MVNGCARGVENFRRGTDIRLPFLIIADGVIVDITDGVVTAIVEPFGMSEIVLTTSFGIAIEDPAPPVAPAGDEQIPHGFVTIGAEITETLPVGQMTEVTLLYLTPDMLQTYAPSIWLRGE